MSRPEVSVVLPVFDAEQTLPAAMESLLAQTGIDFEIVAIDDGSADSSPEILRRFAKQDARVRVIYSGGGSPRQSGLVAALNAGIADSRGEFIARMDADDVCRPERLAKQAAFLRNNPDLGVAGCRVEFGGDTKAAAGYFRHVEFVNSLLTHEDISLSRFRESPFAHPSVMFRRKPAESSGGYRDGNFPEDYELWLRWLEDGVRMAKLPDVLLTWNDPPGRLSRVHSNYSVENFYAVKAEYLARWLAKNNPHHPRIVVIGAGRITRRRVDFLRRSGIVVEAFADIDRAKKGRVVDGARVIHHDDIPSAGSCFVVPFVGKVGAADFIRAMLESRGFVRGRDFIEAAM